MRSIRSAAAVAALLLPFAAACNRTGAGGATAQGDSASTADSTAAAGQKREALPPGVSVDTQKVDTAGVKETPQQDQDDTP
ncbi:MAG TPA: hypothetical protein VFH27_02985 [Longimicrobiaceae bacterium]|nr:hypothetical protein [Longimicrobiaceae bacterium]